MKPYKYLSFLPALALTVMATGCSDDEWTPGPEDTATGVSAYFDTPAQTEYIFGSDYSPEDMVITVEVSRQVTEGEAVVPISMSASGEGFTCPASVTFADGEASASFDVNCSGIGKKVYYNVELSLDPDQTNIYSIGLPSVSYQVIQADWLLISDNVKYTYKNTSSETVWPNTSGEMYQLEGTYIFRLTDFWGSGLDMRFECTTPGETAFIPLNNFNREYVDDEDDIADGAYYFYDDANQEYPTWVPGNAEGYPAIEWAFFYANADDATLEMISTESTLFGYISFLGYLDLDNGDGNWYYFQTTFNLKYNPFDKKTD